MLRYRLIFGPIMILLTLGLFWLDQRIAAASEGSVLPPGIVLLALAAVLIVFGVGEFVALLAAKGTEVNRLLATAGCLAACGATYLPDGYVGGVEGSKLLGGVLFVFFAAGLAWHCRRMSPPGALASGGGLMLAMAYLGVLPGLLLSIRHGHSAWVLFAVILTTKCGDIGAYAVGRLIGRHKLIPWLSPGKTWEGLAGALVFAAAAGAGFAALSQATDVTAAGAGEASIVRYRLWPAALAGAALALIGHGGDLTMSLFKRDAGVKDSGASIPGFGGVLDVLDSPLLVGPVAYWLLDAVATR